jgi:glycosyltransferase involved in cell wall biosynthesis
MKILLTSPSMGVGGAERIVAMLAGGLAARGHEVALAAPPGMRDADLVGVPHRRIVVDDHGRALVGAVATARQLAGVVRRFRPDVVHAQNVKAAGTAILAAPAAGRNRPPVLASFQGLLPAEYPRAAQIFKRTAHVACVSEDLRSRLVAAGVAADRVSVINNAVEPVGELAPERRAALDAELGLPAGAPVVAIVGRLVPQKVHSRFLVAARGVADVMPETKMLIVGDGELREEIRARRDALGLADHVLMTGARSDARDLIARADLLVFSSDWEGLSVAALEGLAAGTPVVATDVHGMRELLSTGAGAVVEVDDGTALGAEIVALLRDPARRAEMGAAGRELIATRFALDAMVDAYERRYEQLVAQRRS